MSPFQDEHGSQVHGSMNENKQLSALNTVKEKGRLLIARKIDGFSLIKDSDLNLEKNCRDQPDDENISESFEVKEIRTTGQVLSGMIFDSKLNLLLCFMPLAVMSYQLDWSGELCFIFNFLAMIPLASLLGDFTEEVAAHTNQTIGGLINASFGNAVEVIVGIQALLADEIRVVQTSMLGSILSNLLLVLGTCFLAGGLIYKEQSFNPMFAKANMSLLGLGCIAFFMPTQFGDYEDIENEDALAVSRIVSLLMVAMYALLMVFQLKTHADMFDDEDDDEPEMPMWVSMTGLTVLTGLITILGDYLVNSIDVFSSSSGISKGFVGLVILPIIGNVVEHLTAVKVAMKGKMNLAMGGKFSKIVTLEFRRTRLKRILNLKNTIFSCDRLISADSFVCGTIHCSCWLARR